MNINMERVQMCDLMMATTLIKIQAKHELEDKSTPNSRKEVLVKTVAKWQNLHDLLKSQLDEYDENKNE